MDTITPLEISYDEALELLDRAVAERGEDYVYDGACEYFQCDADNQPGCIVGHVLAYKGMDPELLDKLGLNSTKLAYVADKSEVLKLDIKTKVLLDEVQNRQDTGIPWGKAVSTSRADIERLYA
jgi:hypothetical protein